jgi:hypothetical protein
VIDEKTVASLRRHWEDGWNLGDIDVIMEPMADDVVFSSPFVARVTGGDPEVRGYAALRAYCEDALTRTPGITYTVHAAYVAPSSLILTYSFVRPDNPPKDGIDIMKLDAQNKIVEWISHYPADFTPQSVSS